MCLALTFSRKRSRCLTDDVWTDSLIRTGRPILLLLSLGILPSDPMFAQTAESYRQKAIELSRLKSWDQAIANYRQALDLEPNDPSTHYNLALTLKYKGEAKQAIEEFDAALRLKPKWADAHYGLGATWYDLGEQATALK
jgi:tetratricopeptide (TPR) repeat protein